MLYIVRIATPDILWTANTLGRAAAKWNKTCENRSERLINYNHSTSGYGQPCPWGDSAKNCKLGLHLKLAGLSIHVRRYVVHFLVNECLCEFRGCAEKQTAVSHSSIEAEIFPLMLDHLRKLTLLGMWLIPSRWKLWEATPSVLVHIRSYLRCTANGFTHSMDDVETSMRIGKFNILKPNKWDF